MMNDEDKKETSLKFVSKSEIAECIKVLTPFTVAGNANMGNNKYFLFAEEKIKELTKLL